VPPPVSNTRMRSELALVVWLRRHARPRFAGNDRGRGGRHHWINGGLRRCFPTLMTSATAISETTSDEPPNEMNGSGTPVTGQADVTTPMLTKAWRSEERRVGKE